MMAVEQGKALGTEMVTKAQLEAVLRLFGMEAHVDEVMTKLDIDKSGGVDVREFLMAGKQIIGL